MAQQPCCTAVPPVPRWAATILVIALTGALNDTHSILLKALMSPSPTSSPLPCALFTSRISPTEVQPSSLCTYPWSQTLQSASLSTIQQFSRPPTSWSTEARKAKHSFTGSLAARVSQADTALQQKVCLTPWSCCGRDFSFCLHCHRYWGRNGLEPHYGWELVGDSCVITEHVALNLCSPRNTINSLNNSPIA